MMTMSRKTNRASSLVPGERKMRKPIFVTAAALTALGIALPSFADNAGLSAPVELIPQGSGVSITSAGQSAPAGYFVGADGSVQYRDASDTTSVEFTAPQSVSAPAPSVTAPIAPTLFDTPAPQNQSGITLDALQSAFAPSGDAMMPVSDTGYTEMSAPSLDEVMLEDVTVDASAGAYSYTSEPVSQPMMVQPSFNSMPSYAPAPVAHTQTASETYEYVVTDDNTVQEITTSGFDSYVEPAAPMYAPAPVMAEQTYSVVSEPAPMAAPYVEAAPMPSYSYTDQSYATIDAAQMPTETFTAPAATALDYAQPIDRFASLDPAPALMSGRDFANRGDGSYGQSTIKRSGEGPSSQSTDLFVAKSTIIDLPVEAHDIVVADPTSVRAILRTAKQVVLIGLKVGQTNINFFDDSGKQILNLEVGVRYDLRPLRTALARTFPNTNVEIETVLGEVIVKGATGGPAEAQAIRDFIRRYLYSAMISAGVQASADDIQFVDRLTTSSDDQVLVKVRIAEMRRSVIKQFGVDFNLASDAAISAATGGLASNLTNFGSITNSFGVNGAALGGVAANIAGSFQDANFGALVRAFERHNVMRVLAEPTLTAVSGETASFLAGGQFPYPTSVEDGNIGFTFRDFGVALEFTPVVVGDGRISLTVATEISELTTEGALSAGNISIPGISVRRANTTVELPSGGTMSIAGMLLQRDANAHNGLPGLKNVPVIGQLFSSSDYQKQETELVILVTPYVVKPGQEKDFRLPTDGFAPASDFDFFLLGRLHKVYGAGDQDIASARKALQAPFGFIMQ